MTTHRHDGPSGRATGIAAALLLAAAIWTAPARPEETAMTGICTGSPRAAAHDQFDGLCAAVRATLEAAGNPPLSVHVDAITPHLLRIRLADPLAADRPPETIEIGLTDTVLSPAHHRPLAADILAAARRTGLLPPS